ncbi:MAG: hypothetical protein QOC77_2905 [Thermoleophilaceae bacterium]|jgi:hypothetical protein|nr:hypothetical protein [Thermoleophilaceae bacterium]
MRPALLALALVLTLFAEPAHATLWPQPERYSAALRYDAHAQVLSGTERIAFRNDGPEALSAVWLRVWPNGYGSCAHPWASVGVVGGGRSAGWSVACTALKVRLAREVPAGGTAAVRVALRVQVPPTADRFGQDSAGVYLGNALPLLAVEDAHGPALEPYTGLGDPFYSLTSRWSVRLDLPSGLTAATTGVVHGRVVSAGRGMKRLRIVAAHARDFSIVIGSFSVDTVETAGGVRLRRFRPRGGSSRRKSLATLDVARAAVEAYSAWYGPPGEREIDLAPGPASLGSFGSGMEFPGLVLTPDIPGVVAHELAHQWWYGLVGDDQWRSPWLDEAFAEFSARRLPAGVVGQDDLSCDSSNPVRPFGSAPLTSPMSHWDAAGAEAYYRTVYLGGTCALRSLEADWGPDAMTAFLRSYAAAHRFGVVTTADFVSAVRAAAPPGYDVDAYLKRARIELP